MELVAILITDLPLNPESFRATLFQCSRSVLAGAISQSGMTAVHSFGEADSDEDVREVRVECRLANTAPKAALTELRKRGFQPAMALEFHSAGDPESREDAWALLGLYAAELRGWVVTSYVDFDEAVARTGQAEGLLHAPIGGRHKGVLISSSTLRLLTP